jgi:hypothetical protein
VHITYYPSHTPSDAFLCTEKIDEVEMLDLVFARHHMAMNIGREKFMKSDENTDMEVTFEEFFADKIRAGDEKKGLTKENAREMFDLSDLNSDGVISLEEFDQRTLDFWKGRAKAWVEMGDANKDGHMDENEFEAYHKEL